MPKTGNVRNGNRSNKTIRVRWIDIMINKKVARFFLLCILISISHSFNGCKKADEKSKAVKPYPKREVEHTYTSTVFISFDLEESLDSRAAYEFIEALEKVTMRDMVIPQGLNLIDLSIVDVSRDHLSWDSILETEDSFYKYKSRLKRNAEGIIISFRLKIIIDTECVLVTVKLVYKFTPMVVKKQIYGRKNLFPSMKRILSCRRLKLNLISLEATMNQ